MEDGETQNISRESIGRFFFDNLANYILVIIMVNIVAGIIIETFGQLREETKEKKDDMEDICFICGNER